MWHTESYSIIPACVTSREDLVLHSLKFLSIKISLAAGAPPAWFNISHTAHISYENHKYMCVQVEN